MAQTYSKIGKVTSASVLKCTGKDWDQWLTILDKAGARSWTHQEITAFLKKRHKLGPWWQQGVAMGFEIAIGKRIEGQNAKGQYTVTATKSIAQEVSKVWTLLISEEGQAAWLKPLFAIAIQAGQSFETEDGFFGEIRTIRKQRRIRLSWQDPNWDKKTAVQLTLVAKPAKRMILAIDHSQIRDTKTVTQMRARWREAADRIGELAGSLSPKRKSAGVRTKGSA